MLHQSGEEITGDNAAGPTGEASVLVAWCHLKVVKKIARRKPCRAISLDGYDVLPGRYRYAPGRRLQLF